jgi:hypothetical protein
MKTSDNLLKESENSVKNSENLIKDFDNFKRISRGASVYDYSKTKFNENSVLKNND